MAIQTITPRMAKALDDGSPLRVFADVWLQVQHDLVDTQADFQASAAQQNMDFTTAPGSARLATLSGAYSLEQTSDNASILMRPADGYDRYVFQSFTVSPGRIFAGITIKVDNSGGPTTNVGVYIVKGGIPSGSGSRGAFFTSAEANLATSSFFSISAGYSGEVTAWKTGEPSLPEGEYYFFLSPGDTSTNVNIRYQNTDAYAGGAVASARVYGYLPSSVMTWDAPVGDLYFKISLSGYHPSGGLTSKTLDVGSVPAEPGEFSTSYAQPIGTSLEVDLYGANSADFSGATVYLNAYDGMVISPFRYWYMVARLSANSTLDQTPEIDTLEVLFPNKRLKLATREPLRYADGSLRNNYAALLDEPEITTSQVALDDRVSSGGDLSATLVDPSGETIQRIISSHPLKNYRAVVSLGADTPGFAETDLLRYFIGTVEAGSYSPRYRKDAYRLTLKFKNAILELTARAPNPEQTGLLDFETVSINHDKVHVLDSALDIIRGKARIAARHVDVQGILAAKQTIGDSSGSAGLYVVRRSNAAGLPDTRIKTPEEVRKLISAHAIIADGFWVLDELGRLSFAKYDAAGAPEAVWADETMVRTGTDAVPIEEIDSIDLGYDSRLFTGAFMGCAWDGAGGGWEAFSAYAHVDTTAADDWGMGKGLYLNFMEKNLLEASKWLGPETGYGGETIARLLTKRFVDRHKYPPAVLRGVVTRNSQFRRSLGSVVQIWSKEFCKFKRRGIALSESINFMVLSKRFNGDKTRVMFDLLELT